MTHINSEGKINDNSYLVDAWLFRVEKNLSLYVIENEGEKVMIDAGVSISARKVVNKLKELGLFPIQKIILTHSHWDHFEACSKLEKLMKNEIEVYASEKAIENLKNPEVMNDVFDIKVAPIEGVIPLKEGDIIDLKGFELEILNFFGHTMDSIAVLDRKNKNIYPGDAILDKPDRDTFIPAFMPPAFNENELLKTFQTLRDLKDELNSISLAHSGVWTEEDCDKFITDMEEIHFKTKNAIIEWYSENQEPGYIAKQYRNTFIPNSTVHTEEHIAGLELLISWFLNGLKLAGFIE